MIIFFHYIGHVVFTVILRLRQYLQYAKSAAIFQNGALLSCEHSPAWYAEPIWKLLAENYTYIEAIHVGPGMFEWGRGEMGGEFVGPSLEKKSEFKI